MWFDAKWYFKGQTEVWRSRGAKAEVSGEKVHKPCCKLIFILISLILILIFPVLNRSEWVDTATVYRAKTVICWGEARLEKLITFSPSAILPSSRGSALYCYNSAGSYKPVGFSSQQGYNFQHNCSSSSSSLWGNVTQPRLAATSSSFFP